MSPWILKILCNLHLALGYPLLEKDLEEWKNCMALMQDFPCIIQMENLIIMLGSLFNTSKMFWKLLFIHVVVRKVFAFFTQECLGELIILQKFLTSSN